MSEDLKQSFQQIVNVFGTDIINNKNLANIVADYFSFDRNPAVRNILKAIVSDGYATKISQLKTSKGDPSIDLERYANEIEQSWGYGKEQVRFVLSCIASSIGINYKINNSTNQNQQPILPSPSPSNPVVNSPNIPNQNNKQNLQQRKKRLSRNGKLKHLLWCVPVIIAIFVAFFLLKSSPEDGKLDTEKIVYEEVSDGNDFFGEDEEEGDWKDDEGDWKDDEWEENEREDEWTSDDWDDEDFEINKTYKQSKDNFLTERKSYSKELNKNNVSIDIDYPIAGKAKLVETIRRSIIDILHKWDGVKYNGDVTNVQAMIDFYGDDYLKGFNTDSQGSSRHLSYTIEWETENLVTYMYNDDCLGGMSLHSFYGVTYLKRNSKIIKPIKDPKDSKFNKLLEHYVQKEGGVLCIDGYQDPFLSSDGVTFMWDMGMGRTIITIPYKKIGPFLSDDALEAIGKPRTNTNNTVNDNGHVTRKGHIRGNINVRQSPSIQGTIIAKIVEDDSKSYECLGMVNNWYKIRINGKVGYVRDDMVDWTGLMVR